MLKKPALRLLMCFSAAATLASCAEPKRIVTNLAPPAARLVCEPAGARPVIPAETVIDWARITTVAQAKIEHEGYVRSIRNREGVIAAYILDIEGKLFACSNNAAWLRQWYKDTATPQP